MKIYKNIHLKKKAIFFIPEHFYEKKHQILAEVMNNFIAL